MLAFKISIALVLFLSGANGQYNDSLARNQFYAMASAAMGDNPGCVVQKVFPSSEVSWIFYSELARNVKICIFSILKLVRTAKE